MVVIKKYNLETDMCVELTQWLESLGFEVYPEQDGWDLLAVKGKIKFGIQAKLKPNMKVLTQAICPGPQYRCVAVGNCNYKTISDFVKLAEKLKLIVINMSVDQKAWLNYNKGYYTRNIKQKIDWYYYRHEPKNIYLPPIKVDHPAGVPSPKTVSFWKICVCELERFYIKKGWVNIHDVEEIIKKEFPYRVSKSYARSILMAHYEATKEKDPDFSRCKKWQMKKDIKPPSVRFKKIYKTLEEKFPD